jgi:hypothetical protein
VRYGQSKPTIASVKKAIIQDSIETKKLVEKLIQLVREDERDRVLTVTDRARRLEAGER